MTIAAYACESIFPDNFQSISIAEPTKKLATYESIPAINSALKKIDELIFIANSDVGIVSAIYHEALPTIKELRREGLDAAFSQASDQDKVYVFFYKFSKLIDLPLDYANQIGKQIAGFTTLKKFSDSEISKRLAHFKTDPKATKNILESAINEIIKNPIDNLQLVNWQLEPFAFQYKYIFNTGNLTMFDLFKGREAGSAYLGISFKDENYFDGKDANGAVEFMNHDLMHAYDQKSRDKELFEKFKANTYEKQVRLKKKTNLLLQEAIHEYQKITNPDLRNAIEMAYFITLHEQATTYPVGTTDDLSQQINSYKFSVPKMVKEKRFGKKNQHLATETIIQAFDWVYARAKLDSDKLIHSLAED